jgi:hypothetical protein
MGGGSPPKEAARGTAALALLPTKETLSGAYLELRDRIDQIARQAEQQGSLKVALAGLNSIRQTLDSLARLHDGANVNVAASVQFERIDVVADQLGAQLERARAGAAGQRRFDSWADAPKRCGASETSWSTLGLSLMKQPVSARCAPAACKPISPCRPRRAAPDPHREVHRSGDEAAWWAKTGIDALGVAHTLWRETRPLVPHSLPSESPREGSGNC